MSNFSANRIGDALNRLEDRNKENFDEFKKEN